MHHPSETMGLRENLNAFKNQCLNVNEITLNNSLNCSLTLLKLENLAALMLNS